MAFFCEYNRAFYDTTQGRRQKQAELQIREGGPLGLLRTQEIVVGAADIKEARSDWQGLFAPAVPVEKDIWRFGDGPAIRLIPNQRDEILRLVWQVASLQKAETYLRECQISFTKDTERLLIQSSFLFGLEIHLVE